MLPEIFQIFCHLAVRVECFAPLVQKFSMKYLWRPLLWHQIKARVGAKHSPSPQQLKKIKFLIFCIPNFWYEIFKFSFFLIIFHDSDLYLKHFMTLETTKIIILIAFKLKYLKFWKFKIFAFFGLQNNSALILFAPQLIKS